MKGLHVTLGADISSLKRGLAGAVGAVSSTVKKMGGVAALGVKASIGAGLAGGAAALAGIGKAVSSAASFEQTQIAFNTLIGDAAKAQETLLKLRKLGAETPFEFPELADAGRKLIAFGEGADAVPETLRRIGDVSAGIQAPVNEIAEIYGKARVQGRLFAEDINQLTGRGIPIIGELARQFGVSDSQVKKLVESGQVGFPAIEKAFISLTSEGGKFHGMMAAQSKTTKGLFSTLKDTIGEVFLTLGQPINDAIRPLIAEAADMARRLLPMAQAVGSAIKTGVQWVIATFKSGELLNLVGTGIRLGFASAVNFLWKSLRGVVSAIGQYFVEVVKMVVLGFRVLTTADFWVGMGNALVGVFLGAVSFLQKGIAEALELARPLADIFNKGAVIDSAQNDLRYAATRLGEMAAEQFGQAGDRMAPIGAEIAGQFKESASRIGSRFMDQYRKTGDVVDTSAMRASMGSIIGNIKAAIPKPTELGGASQAVKGASVEEQSRSLTQRLAPVVTSLGRVGGGGYGGGTLDAMREANRLAGKANALLQDIRDKVGRPGVAVLG